MFNNILTKLSEFNTNNKFTLLLVFTLINGTSLGLLAQPKGILSNRVTNISITGVLISIPYLFTFSDKEMIRYRDKVTYKIGLLSLITFAYISRRFNS